MHDYHLMTLANSFAAERRAEADRSRLARMARAEMPAQRPRRRLRRRLGGPLGSMASLLGRVALS